jgi:hypothetical protein
MQSTDDMERQIDTAFLITISQMRLRPNKHLLVQCEGSHAHNLTAPIATCAQAESVSTTIVRPKSNEKDREDRQIVRFEVFTAVTMKGDVFWDIKPQFVLNRRHVVSPLQSPAS